MDVVAKVTPDGGLTLNVGKYGVSIAPGYDAQTLDIAEQQLIEMLAGVSRTEIAIATAKAFMNSEN